MRTQALLHRAQEQAQGRTLEIGVALQEVAQALGHRKDPLPQGKDPPVTEPPERDPPVKETPVEDPSALDGLERFLLLVFLRRYVTYCATRRRFASMNGAAHLFAELKLPVGGSFG